MFVDALAIVAILTNEPEADALTDRLEQATRPITSAIAIFEAAPPSAASAMPPSRKPKQMFSSFSPSPE